MTNVQHIFVLKTMLYMILGESDNYKEFT